MSLEDLSDLVMTAGTTGSACTRLRVPFTSEALHVSVDRAGGASGWGCPHRKRAMLQSLHLPKAGRCVQLTSER